MPVAISSDTTRMGLVRLITVFSLVSLAAPAAEVLRVGKTFTHIAITHEAAQPWRPDDRICAHRQNIRLECGKVVKVNATVALVALDKPSDLVAKGDLVRKERSLFASTGKREPASNEIVRTFSEPSVKIQLHNLSAGTTVGDGFYFPFLHFQRMINSEISLGILPTYLSTSSSSGAFNALGALVTVNYYKNEFFNGLWAQLGAGAYFFSHTSGAVEEQSTSLSMLGTVGWRGKWEHGLNVGIALGGQYVKNPNFTTISITSSDLRVLALFDLGLSF